jgi:hypothetical protein
MLQQQLKRLRRVVRAQQIFADVLEDRSIGQKFRRLIVDKKNVDSSCSVFTGLAR